jgi:hypothetical protein
MENLTERVHELKAIETLFMMHGPDTTKAMKETLFLCQSYEAMTEADRLNIRALWDFLSKFE